MPIPTREQINAWLTECRDALLQDINRLDALQGLYKLYWGLAEVYYVHGDFDAHTELQISVAEAVREVAEHHHLGEIGTRYISYETLCGLGHQGMGLDTLYKMRRLGLYPHDQTALVCRKWGEHTNLHYLRYWHERFNRAIESEGAIQLIAPLCGVQGLLGLLEDRFVVTRFCDGEYRAYAQANAEVNSLWKHGPALALTSDDNERGQDALKKLGVPSGAWFVTLHVRESPYQDFAIGRNVQIADYFPAIGEIAAAGGYVVRIGAPNMTPLPSLPHVIDYAHSDARADYLDVYLLAACKFFLGSQSGPAQIPPTFGVRSYLTNWQMGFRPTYPTDTVIFRRYSFEVRPLSIRESFARKLPYIESPSVYVPGAATIPNTPDEIRELVMQALADAPMSEAEVAQQADYNALQRELTAGIKYNPAGVCLVGREWLKRYGSE